jgi:glycosyltransferase involved in cell wall biosynthesis
MQIVNKSLSPAVSVAVITWNRFEFTQCTLASLEQTLTRYSEIIVVDNHSEIGMQEWLRAWEVAGPNRKVMLLGKNIGPGLACDLAWKEATREYLMRSDNDVQYLPGWLEAALLAFRRLPERALLSLFPPPPTVKTEPFDEELVRASYVGGGSFLMRRSLWNAGVRYTHVTDLDKQDQEFARAAIHRGGHIFTYRRCQWVLHLGESRDTTLNQAE